jgi:hypothetical protein
MDLYLQAELEHHLAEKGPSCVTLIGQAKII